MAKPIDPQLATEVAAEAARDLDSEGRVLVADDRPEALLRAIPQAAVWRRFAAGGDAASAEPPDGPFDAAWLRLPKSRDAIDMGVEMLLARLRPGGTFVLYGGNDEGIKPAARRLDEWLGPGHQVALKRRCRVLSWRAGTAPPGLRPRLSHWRTEFEIVAPGMERRWTTYPGVFAASRLDMGTELLLEALAAIDPPISVGRALDFGCGHGIVAGWLLERRMAARVEGCDADAVAIEAARINLPEGRFHLGDGLQAVAGHAFDLVVSNPPFHDGVQENTGPLRAFLQDSAAHVTPGGELWFVTAKRHRPVDMVLEHYTAADEVAARKGFVVVRARR